MNGWVTVSEWAVEFGRQYPDLLAIAHQQGINQKKPSTGFREIAARISSKLGTDGFKGRVEIDASERPKRVRYLTSEQAAVHLEKEIEEAVEPLNRDERIEEDEKLLTQKEKYRAAEIFEVAKTMSRMFRLDFEVDHANALLCAGTRGMHHPDNLQVLTKAHNVRKNNASWILFTFDEQIEYIKSVIKVQKIIGHKMSVELDEALIDSILARLKLVY